MLEACVYVLQFVALLLGSWAELTTQFLWDCDHSQALFGSSDQSLTDIWNHGFALLAVLYASFICDNRFLSILEFSLYVLKLIVHMLNYRFSTKLK